MDYIYFVTDNLLLYVTPISVISAQSANSDSIKMRIYLPRRSEVATEKLGEIFNILRDILSSKH